ncbi:MAG TPA: MFS transporter [Nevskiaceae bacterium]|nr:MFS transporter [Nevskiaceae bacterium]
MNSAVDVVSEPEVNPVATPAPKRSMRKLIPYVLPTIATGSVTGAIYAILPSLYAKYAAVTMVQLGTLLAALRIWDAVSDPLIGYWSDKTRSPRYGRKPWVIAGSLTLCASVWFLFQVPENAGIAYLGLWLFVFYFGFTAHDVPHLAWGSELAPEYDQRAKLFSFRSMADTTGGFIYTGLPIVLFYLGITASTEYTPEVFRKLSTAMLLLFPLTMIIAVRFAPAGEVAATERGDLKSLFRDALRNPPLLRFMSAFVISGIGSGVYVALFFPYFDSYLHIGDKVPHMLVMAMAAQFISQPFWAKMVGILGKHRTWAYGWIANSLSLLPMMLIQPGPGAVLPVMIATFFYCFTNGVSSVAPQALLGDIVDYEVLTRGVDRAGNYYALYFFLAKLTSSAGAFVFVILGVVFGYQIAEGAVNTDFANKGMMVSFCVLPSLFQFLAIPLIWNFPIDRRRHAIIRKRLGQREARLASGER